MPSLQLRELPERIYHRLQTEAQKERRSFSQQAMVALSRGLNMTENPQNRRAELLKNILNNPVKLKASVLADQVDLVREDRDR